MPNIQSDLEYKANVSFRNSTFDMSRIEMFVLEAAMDPKETDAPLLFVDLLDLQPGVEESQARRLFLQNRACGRISRPRADRPIPRKKKDGRFAQSSAHQPVDDVRC